LQPTTHLSTPKGWKAESAWLADLQAQPNPTGTCNMKCPFCHNNSDANSQRARSRGAKCIFGGLAAASFWTPLGRVAFQVEYCAVCNVQTDFVSVAISGTDIYSAIFALSIECTHTRAVRDSFLLMFNLPK